MANDINNIASEVAILMGKSFDIPFKRGLANSAVQVRATILKQQYDRDGRYPSGSEDAITIPMQKVPAAECLSDEIDCEVHRTVDKVPRPIRKNRTSIPFTFVGNSTQEVSFIFLKPEEVYSFIHGTRFINKDAVYMYYNDYIYTANHVGGKITIRDAFEDPRELLTLQGCDKKPCKISIDIDETMKTQIKTIMIETMNRFRPVQEEVPIRINEQG